MSMKQPSSPFMEDTATIHVDKNLSTCHPSSLTGDLLPQASANDECHSDGLDVCPAQAYLQEIVQVPGYSISRIASEVEVSRVTISRLLKGRVKHANVKLFNRLLSLYCVACFDERGQRQYH